MEFTSVPGKNRHSNCDCCGKRGRVSDLHYCPTCWQYTCKICTPGCRCTVTKAFWETVAVSYFGTSFSGLRSSKITNTAG